MGTFRTGLVLLLLAAGLNAQSGEPTRPPAPATQREVAEPQVTAPRGGDDPALAPLLASAKAAVARGDDGAALLADQELAPLREVAAFRALVRQHAPRGEIRIAPPGEPGDALAVHAIVKDAQGKPVAGALVYAYHTNAQGWYSDRAPHFSGGDGDFGHARLFGYVRTDAEGRFALHTIRPAGYPRSTLPQHVHLHVDVGDRSVLVTEILFDDDPRLGAELRAQAVREGFVIAKVEKQKDGAAVVRPEFTVDVPAEPRRDPEKRGQ